MHVVLFLVFGLAVGALVRLIVPGSAPGGFLVSMLIGVMGAFIGGFLGRAIGAYPSYQGTGSLIAALLGAICLVAIWQPLILRRSAPRRL